MFAQSVDTKKMGSIADDDHAVQMVRPRNHSQPRRRFGRIVALRFRNNSRLVNTMRQQIVVPDTTLRVLVPHIPSAKRDDEGSQPTVVKIERMVETRP
jgi:hypothetical protein